MREPGESKGPIGFGAVPGVHEDRLRWSGFSARARAMMLTGAALIGATGVGVLARAIVMRSAKAWVEALSFAGVIAYVGWRMWRSGRQYVVLDPAEKTVEFYRFTFLPHYVVALHARFRRRHVYRFDQIRSVLRHQDRRSRYLSIEVPRGRVIVDDGFEEIERLWSTLRDRFPVRTRPDHTQRAVSFVTLLLLALIVLAGALFGALALGWL